MAVSFAVLGIFLMLDIMFMVNFFFVRALRKWTNAKTLESENELKDTGKEIIYRESKLEKILFGWILGAVKKDPLYPRRFPNWKPIPWYIGVTTTSILLLISISFLTPAFLFKQFGVNMSGVGINPELCDAEAQDAALIDLNDTLKEMMGFDLALDQFDTVSGITQALQSDVALYGTPGFTCKPSTARRSTGSGTYALTGSIDQWVDPSKRYEYPAVKWGTFFPGYCRAYFDSEIKLAQLEICGPREICKCPTLPNTAPFTWIGLGGLEVCLMKVCMTFDNIPCGQTADFSLYKEMFPPNNYRVQQLKYAQEQQKLKMKEQNFPNSAEGISSKATETFSTLLQQIDLASNIYAVYACLSLYFPAPVDVFREPYGVAIKGFFFGVGKNVFILMVIALWWAFDYIGRLLHNPDIQLMLANIRIGDPCFLDGNFMLKRKKVLGDLCKTILPREQNFTILAGTSTSILNEVEYFVSPNPNGCECLYPMRALKAFDTSAYPRNVMESFEFTRTVRSLANVFLPAPDTQFVGNTTVCQDSALARRIIMQAPDTRFSGPQLWLQSGLLAALVIKAVLANFVIALLKVADPFVVCNGEFLWIPAKFGLGLGGLDMAELFANFKTTKEASMFYINLRDLLFWGLIMHLALWNLMSSAYTDSEKNGVTDEDIAVMKAAIIVAVVVATLGLTAVMFLRVKKRLNKQKVKELP